MAGGFEGFCEGGWVSRSIRQGHSFFTSSYFPPTPSPPLRTRTPWTGKTVSRWRGFRPFRRDTANGGETEPLPSADFVRIMRNHTNCADRLGSLAADRLPQALDRPA
ncbi:hypothetical protein GCM10010402_52970 [Actinomadura luteofluorescens]